MEVVMKFMDIHSGAKGITKEMLESEHQKDLNAQKGTDVKFTGAYADPKSGKLFCLSEGPSLEAVKAVHDKAGHEADEWYELPLEVK
jgi:hypothetical protein